MGARRAEEHAARLQAEAAARHATQRLAVAQQQIAEYAEGRAADARGLADDSGKLDELLAQVQRGSSDAILTRRGRRGCRCPLCLRLQRSVAPHSGLPACQSQFCESRAGLSQERNPSPVGPIWKSYFSSAYLFPVFSHRQLGKLHCQSSAVIKPQVRPGKHPENTLAAWPGSRTNPRRFWLSSPATAQQRCPMLLRRVARTTAPPTLSPAA